MGSAVLFKKIEGKHVPIYFSAAGPLPPGSESMIPKAMIRVWMDQYREPESMVSRLSGRPMDVDVSKAQTTISYGQDGVWSYRD